MLHIHCKTDVESDTPEQATTENGTVLGVDLGVNNLAVASTGTFWSGDEFDHWRREYEKRRGDLQDHGTRWAHENIQSVGRKEEGRFKQTLHRTSNELVAEAREYECSVIAFENSTAIRKRTGAPWGHKWAFNRLYVFIGPGEAHAHLDYLDRHGFVEQPTDGYRPTDRPAAALESVFDITGEP